MIVAWVPSFSEPSFVIRVAQDKQVVVVELYPSTYRHPSSSLSMSFSEQPPLETIKMSSNENTPSSPRTVTLEVNTDYSDAARFPAWVALMVFSIVCLAALESRKGLFSADSAGEKWALAVCLMSMLFAFLAVVAYLIMRSIFVGQIPEMGLLVFLTACWASGLPAIMNRKSIKTLDCWV